MEKRMNRVKHFVIYAVIALISCSQIVACGGKINKKGTPEETKAKIGSNVDTTKNSEAQTLEESTAEVQEVKDESFTINVKDTKINLADWKNKSITEIIDELANTGLKFTGIDGTESSDKSEMIIDPSLVKESFNHIGSNNLLEIYMGENEFDDFMELSYYVDTKTLGLNIHMHDDSEYYEKVVTLGPDKLGYEELKEIGYDNIIEKTNLFETKDTLGITTRTNDYSMETLLNENYIFSFTIYEYEMGNIEDTGMSEVINSNKNITEVKDNLGIISYNNKELDLAELVEMEDMDKVIDKLAEFGMTGANYRFKGLVKSDKVPERNVDTTDIEEIKAGVKEITKAFEDNKEDEVFTQSDVSVTMYLDPNDEMRTGKISIVYKTMYQMGQESRKIVQLIRNEGETGIEWTKEKISLAENPKEEAEKLITGLNNTTDNEYYLEDRDYEVEVWLDSYEGNVLENIIITKKLIK